MADVSLARQGEQIWLVAGEEHLDLLLIGALPPEVTVELIECATPADLQALWRERSPQDADGAQPWALNPLISRRLLAQFGLLSGLVQFSPWSAMIGEEAEQEIASAATWLVADPKRRLTLRQFAPRKAVPGLADLQRLRGQLVAAALERAGAGAAQVDHETTEAGSAKETEQLRILLAPAAG